MAGTRTLRLRLSIVATLVFVLFVVPTTGYVLSTVVDVLDESPNLVELTFLENAEQKGAVCLDGSPPGYHLQRGYGSGADNWLIHIEGGAWCGSLESCLFRADTDLGSSKYMDNYVDFDGILSSLPSGNPDFYDWNKVMIRYCDGASLSGDVAGDRQIRGRTIYFRGQRIWEAIMDQLVNSGLGTAKQALLTGCSAGGLATYIHCDEFRALLPKDATVKCLGDGGFFLDAKDITGKRTMREFYKKVANLQNIGARFPNCISKMEPGLCFFPHEIIKSIKTPLFILNSGYDSWQIQNVLVPSSQNPTNPWYDCTMDINKCNSTQMEIIQDFRNVLLDDLSPARHEANWGVLVDSCFTHCQTLFNITWHSEDSPRVNGKTLAEAVGDWYFDKREVKEIDCRYPCNPTC